MLINRQQNLQTLCEQIRVLGAPLALDTEFISERRYAAKLCLVQLFAQNGNEQIEALVDPFAVDLKPLLEIIADEKVAKIVHAGGQDLQIFAQGFGCRARHVFDTQIAAAFLGFGHQIGYADLVRRLCGAQLSKHLQFTDWSARPLSEAQMEYALDDVRFLPQMYQKLRGDLSSRGRLEWAKAEFRRAEAKAENIIAPQELYRRLNISGLSRKQLGALQELAQTRETLAQNADKPPSFIVPDLVLLQVARQPPQTLQELRSTRGMPGISAEAARELLQACERAANRAPETLPPLNSSERPDSRAEAVVALLGVVTALRADEEHISRTYLAPREQVSQLVNWWLSGENAPPDLPLLNDWRGEIVGRELLELLQGHHALALDAAALGDKTAKKSLLKILKIN